MSTFNSYRAWETCVRIRYPEAAILHESRNPPTREVTHVVGRRQGETHIVAEWDMRAGTGTVNPVITRPFG